MKTSPIPLITVFLFAAHAALAQSVPETAPAAVADAAQGTQPAFMAIPVTTRPNGAVIPKLNPRFAQAHSNNVVRAQAGDIDILFMGDSITDWWRNPGRGPEIDGAIPFGGKAVFEKYFGAMKVANFGIAGDTTQGVLWRLRNGEGEGFSPKAIMLMIGTNNTGGNSAAEIAMGVANVVFELRKDFPQAKILLLAIFPRSGPNSGVRAKINEINKMISALTDGQNVLFMDIGPKFLNAEGYIPRDVMSDGLHPTSKGYEIWAEAVQDKLSALMQ